ncbi:MAG: DUF2931 family protein [Janthinobacterium lividum]
MPIPYAWLIGILLLAVVLAAKGLLGSSAARSPAYQTDKFELSAGPCTPDGYPATILEGRFSNSLGGSFPVPYGHTLDGNWGRSGIGWAVGDALQPVPDSLELRWFSYTEDKFYEGHFRLPQQHLYELLKQGNWNAEAKKQETYTTLTVCVVPTGAVFVWLGGTNKVLVGRYQAHEIQYDFATFIPMAKRAEVVQEGRASLPAHVKQEIATGTISAKQWDAYLKTYPWHVAFSQPVTLTDFAIRYVNAENTRAPLTADMSAYAQTLLAPSPKPVPSLLNLYVAGAYGRKRLLKIARFDEHELRAAFQALATKYPTEVITLFVDTDERMSKVSLSLRAGGQIISLPKSPVLPFDL